MTSRWKPYGRRHLIGTALLTVAATSLNTSATALVVPAGSIAQPAAAATTPARTSALEVRRVDSVPTPRLVWDECPFGDPRLRCTTVKLPLDYDDPKGPTVELAVIKQLAGKPKARIGSLFVNPGGPGASASTLVGSGFFGKALEDRFDLIGLDPPWRRLQPEGAVLQDVPGAERRC